MSWRPSRLTVILVALAGVVVLGLLIRQGIESYLAPERGQAETAAAGPPIGGPFTLVDQTGRTRTDEDFRGKFMLVYFGYTHCPDVCPMTLSRMGAVLDELDAEGERVVPVFITTDPERDTVARLEDFTQPFHPRLVALTGSPENLKAAAKAYRVYSKKKAPDEARDPDPAAARAGEHDGGHGYLVDHTAILYLMGPDGRYLTHFDHTASAEDIAADIAGRL